MRHFLTTLLVVAIGVCKFHSYNAKHVSKSKHQPTHLAWLFDPTRDHKYEVDEKQGRQVCESKECQDIARILRESIDDSVDPCTDFYDYACGNWAKNNPLPKGMSEWHMLMMVQEKVKNLTAGILKEENQPDDILSLKLARKLYKSCMNLDDMERRGLEPIVITMARSGGWPMILEPEEYDEDAMTWQKLDDYYIRLTGEPSFLRISVRPTFNDTKLTPYLVLPRPPLASEMFSGYNETDSTEMPEDSEETGREPDSQERGSKEVPNDEKDQQEGELVKKRVKHEADSNQLFRKMKAKYREFIIQVTMAIAEARGFPITEEKIAQDVDDLLEFIIKMQQLRSFSFDDEMMTLEEFQNWYDSLGYTGKTSEINWLRKFSILFDDANVKPDKNLTVRVAEREYVERLAGLLDETAPRTIVNYVHWRIGSRALEATTREMRNLIKDLVSVQFETDEEDKNDDEEDVDDMEARNQKCTYEVEASTIIGYEYVKRYFDKDTLTAAKKMIANIREEVESQIKKCDWMDESTKTYALEKLSGMDELVGYPAWYENKTAVNNYFKGLVVSPSYFENLINYSKQKNWKLLKLVTESSMENDIENMIDPTEVNAFYSPISNTIIITAADLQGPIFDATRPAMVNFGMIGLIVGHEINHGFDSNNFAKQEIGVAPTNILVNVYNERAACFVEQYNKYMENMSLPNVTMKDYGNRTAGENIADSMGMYAVFHAFKNREKANGRPEPTLPGFEDMSNDQLLFLSFANMWCQAFDEKKLARRLQFDSHSSAKLRVIGPVSNSREFSEAYNCPVGSPMNPEKKCNIWAE